MEMKPGYQQTEIGVIPKDWDVKALGQLSEFITSGSRGWATHYSDSGALFVRSQNIRDGHLDFTDRQCVIPPAGSEGSRTRLSHSDLLITMTGNSVGNVAWVERDLGEAYISQHVGLVRLSRPSFAEYICLFLAPGSPGNWQIWASQTGQSKPGLNLKNLEEFRVALPPLAEQRAIAEGLSDAHDLIESLEQVVAKKLDLKQATMQVLLSGKKRLPGFTGEWEVKLLGDIASATKGHQLNTATISEYGRFEYLNGGITPSGYTDKSNTPGNTISISEGGNSCGYVQFMFEPFWCGGHCYAITARTIDNRFLFHALKSQQSSIMRLRVGSGLPNIQKQRLLAFTLCCPTSKDEQTAIAAILSDMDAEIARLEAKLAKARQIKQGMMQELLTGRIRLI